MGGDLSGMAGWADACMGLSGRQGAGRTVGYTFGIQRKREEKQNQWAKHGGPRHQTPRQEEAKLAGGKCRHLQAAQEQAPHVPQVTDSPWWGKGRGVLLQATPGTPPLPTCPLLGRGGMIQTYEQYQFVHHVMSLYEKQLSHQPPE